MIKIIQLILVMVMGVILRSAGIDTNDWQLYAVLLIAGILAVTTPEL